MDELLFISFVLFNDYKLFACTRNNSILFSKFPGLQLQPETGSLGLPTLVERGSWLFTSGSGYTEGGEEGAVGGWFGGDEAQIIMEIRKQEKTEGIYMDLHPG